MKLTRKDAAAVVAALAAIAAGVVSTGDAGALALDMARDLPLVAALWLALDRRLTRVEERVELCRVEASEGARAARSAESYSDELVTRAKHRGTVRHLRDPKKD